MVITTATVGRRHNLSEEKMWVSKLVRPPNKERKYSDGTAQNWRRFILSLILTAVRRCGLEMAGWDVLRCSPDQERNM